MSVCQVCLDCLCHHQGRQEHDSSTEVFFLHHYDTASLKSSYEANCFICRNLWSQLERILPRKPYQPSKPRNEDALTYMMVQNENLLAPEIEGSLTLAAWINPDATLLDGIEECKLQMFCMLREAEDDKKLYPDVKMSHTTSSEESWATIMGWLETCSSDHVECFIPRQPSWYPTRLLNIDNPSAGRVRLNITKESQPKGPYLTLSHCWGNANNLKLTTLTLSALKRGIEVSTLPMTFQHALQVATRLQIKHIWIDSLCIYQDEDDKSDWLKEAALMHKVYSHSFLNLAATGARGSAEGFYASRDPETELKPITVPCSPKVTSDGQPGPQERFLLSDPLLFERELMSAPLNRRGWVLQERMLCPRVLHFGKRQLFWECKRGVLCERYPRSLPQYMSRMVNTTFKSFDMTVVRPGGGPLARYHLWSKIVRAYANTELSFPGDKAIAISGLAKSMQDKFQDKYVAGLWRRCLETQLLWNVSRLRHVNGQKSTRGTIYRAPTWSWLSVDGEINPGRCLERSPLFEVLDVSLQYLTNDTTGLITSGQIRAKGRLRSLTIHLQPLAENMEVTPGSWKMTVGGRALVPSQPGVTSGRSWAMLVLLDSEHHDFNLPNQRQEMFTISVGGPWDCREDPFSDHGIDPWHDMLLLACVDKSRGIYHRFGLARFDTEDHPDVLTMVQQYDSDEAQLPCVEHDPQTHMHTILLE